MVNCERCSKSCFCLIACAEISSILASIDADIERREMIDPEDVKEHIGEIWH